MRSTRLALGSAICALSTLIASAAGASNLLVNGNFDEDLSGWINPDTHGTWQAADATGSPSSGSVVIESPIAGNSQALFQCVNVTGGTDYHVGARIAIAGQPLGVAKLFIVWNGGPDCSGLPLGLDSYTAGLSDTGGKFQSVAGIVTAPPAAQSAFVHLEVSDSNAEGAATAAFDDVYFQSDVPTNVDATILSLDNGRFAARATYATASAGSGDAHVLPLTGETGYMWFFDRNNVEMVVKVLDGCALDNFYWIYAGGLTDQGVTFTVTDTQTGLAKSYSNPLGRKWVTVTDSSALAVCP